LVTRRARRRAGFCGRTRTAVRRRGEPGSRAAAGSAKIAGDRRIHRSTCGGTRGFHI